MNIYLMIFVGALWIAYGVYILMRKNVMVYKPYEILVIGCLLLFAPNRAEISSYVTIILMLILVIILFRRNYSMYNTAQWRVKEEIIKILERHNIMHSVEENRIVLSENQGVIKLSSFGKNITVNFNKATIFSQEMLKELKDSQFSNETGISYSGVAMILLGILLIGVISSIYL